MGDKNLLIDTVSFLEDSSAEIAKAKKTKTVKINVKSDMDDCVYFLMQDKSVVAKNKTGVFEFQNTGKEKRHCDREAYFPVKKIRKMRFQGW